MVISNRLKSVKAWLGLVCLGFAFFSSSCANDEASSDDSSQHHRHHGGGGGGAADITDMDKAECSISRILPVRHPRCRDNNNCALTNLSVEELGVFVQIQIGKRVCSLRPMGDVSSLYESINAALRTAKRLQRIWN